jgi:glycosyltransferase involved in cell wall biosynthesis
LVVLHKDNFIILVAPNISEHMGGEAIKALELFKHFKKINSNTIQITHARNRVEVTNDLKLNDVYFVEEDWVSLFLWKSVFLRPFMNVNFSRKAVKIAEKLAKSFNVDPKTTIIHQTGPNSPVLPRAISKVYLNTFGPINGNIYYPKALRHKESLVEKIRRSLHMPLQILHSRFFTSLKNADMIFVAGGKRTKDSLKVGGCLSDIMVDTIDSGVADSLLDRPRIKHQGNNYRFIHFGRIVKFKCTDILIKSLAKTKNPIILDIVGYGPEQAKCKRLVASLGLENRVNFCDWREREALFDSFNEYRAVVLPSIGDSNGMAVQEAMAHGLPAICLNWGGPQMLIDHSIDGILIDPLSENQIIEELAFYLDNLSENAQAAESLSIRAHQKSQSWRWSEIASAWMKHYDTLDHRVEVETYYDNNNCKETSDLFGNVSTRQQLLKSKVKVEIIDEYEDFKHIN